MTNVLIVEDHVSMRESLTTALTAAGDFSVVGEVPNADYALDFCKHLHPELGRSAQRRLCSGFL